MIKRLIPLLILITYTISALSNLDGENTIPYHDFNWLDEDNYTLEVAFTSTPSASRCCLYNGTNICSGACTLDSATYIISCRFIGGNCEADADNPDTKYYYGVYCSDTECQSAGTIDDSISAEVTVAISKGNYIKSNLLLMLTCLLLV